MDNKITDGQNNEHKKRSGKKLPLWLTEDEVHKMFRSAERGGNPRDIKILKMLYYFGLRNDELCSLDISDINLHKHVIKISQGKGGKDRMIPIIEINPLPGENQTIDQEIRGWIGLKKKGIFIQGDRADGKISDRTIRRIVKDYAHWSKIPRSEEVHPHTLRHSYATHLINMGVKLEVIQRLLGHVKMDTTLIYAHMGVDNLRDEVLKQVWISRTKKDLPKLFARIQAEKNVQKQIIIQNEFISKAIMALLGIVPE